LAFSLTDQIDEPILKRFREVFASCTKRASSSVLGQEIPPCRSQDLPRDHENRNDFINAFFNTKAFAPVAQLPRGIYGNMGRNVISGPAMARSDLAVMRNFRLPGREYFSRSSRRQLPVRCSSPQDRLTAFAKQPRAGGKGQ
jgi:hypothetical protein